MSLHLAFKDRTGISLIFHSNGLIPFHSVRFDFSSKSANISEGTVRFENIYASFISQTKIYVYYVPEVDQPQNRF